MTILATPPRRWPARQLRADGGRSVCLCNVGGVAAREVSRFARNSRDWQQVIEMCRVVDTVLIGKRLSQRAMSCGVTVKIRRMGASIG
jgi:hypothetical protein